MPVTNGAVIAEEEIKEVPKEPKKKEKKPTIKEQPKVEEIDLSVVEKQLTPLTVDTIKEVEVDLPYTDATVDDLQDIFDPFCLADNEEVEDIIQSDPSDLTEQVDNEVLEEEKVSE